MDRLLDKVDWGASAAGHPCWEWTGSRYHNGYGQLRMRLRERPKRAHVVSHALFKGPVPPGLMVLHTCDNPGCVNPEHLYAGTSQDNSDDKLSRGRAPSNRITEREVEQIKAEYRSGKLQREIAQRLGIHQATVSRVLSGKNLRRVSTE